MSNRGKNSSKKSITPFARTGEYAEQWQLAPPILNMREDVESPSFVVITTVLSLPLHSSDLPPYLLSTIKISLLQTKSL